jgi:histidine triad (HIT) family protein
MSNDDCLFCKIRDGKIPSSITYRDDDVFAFKDIGPKAPLHELVVPTRHVATLADATPADA